MLGSRGLPWPTWLTVKGEGATEGGILSQLLAGTRHRLLLALSSLLLALEMGIWQFLSVLWVNLLFWKDFQRIF